MHNLYYHVWFWFISVFKKNSRKSTYTYTAMQMFKFRHTAELLWVKKNPPFHNNIAQGGKCRETGQFKHVYLK